MPIPKLTVQNSRDVILSEVKNLFPRSQILHFAQNDIAWMMDEAG